MKLKTRERFVLLSSDFSSQEPRILAQMCGDPKMIQAFKEGKDLYASIASIAFHTTYADCLEFFPKGTPIKKVDGVWKICDESESDKLADGETDYSKEGKGRRSKAKAILLGKTLCPFCVN